MPALPDGATEIYAVATRLSQLTGQGYPAAGNSTFATDQLIKATIAPTLESGDTIAVKGADGTLKNFYKHGDMPKWFAITLEFARPDPELEALLAGGTILTTNAVALTTPGTVTATPATTGGTLKAGTYQYEVAAANQYGETVPSATVTAVVASGTTGSVGLSVTAVTGAKKYLWFGRTVGVQRLLAVTTTPTYTDTGAALPTGHPPVTNTTAGPGNVGYAAPNLGIVGNPNGVALELWSKAIKNGVQQPTLPYYRWLLPLCRNFHIDARNVTNAALENTWVGEGYGNANFGTGPFSDWQFPSTQVFQRVRASKETLPTIGLSYVPATA